MKSKKLFISQTSCLRIKSLMLLIVVASCVIQIFGENYKAVANTILYRIEAVKGYMENIRRFVNANMGILNTTELNIRTESRIAGIQKTLDQKSNNPGIKNCKDLFEKVLASVLQDSRKLVLQRLNNVLLSLDNFNSILNPIKEKLNGELNGEIADCEKSPKTCNLTVAYPAAVDGALNSAISIYNDTKAPATFIIDQALSTKINNDLVNPVNACVASLK